MCVRVCGEGQMDQNEDHKMENMDKDSLIFVQKKSGLGYQGEWEGKANFSLLSFSPSAGRQKSLKNETSSRTAQ